VKQAANLYGAHQKSYEATRGAYGDVATSYGLNPENVTKIVVGDVPGVPKAAAADATQKVTSQAEYDALPAGTEFLDPKGVKRRKPK
jgi:hypothetical protein